MYTQVQRVVYSPDQKGFVSFLADCFAKVEATGFMVGALCFYTNDAAPSNLPSVEDMTNNLPKDVVKKKPVLDPNVFSPAQQAVVDRAWELVKDLPATGEKEGEDEPYYFWGAELFKDVSDATYKDSPLRMTLESSEVEGLKIEVYG